MVNIIEITTQWEKKDDRTNKSYAGYLTINVEFGPEHCSQFGVRNEFIAAFGGIVAKAGFYGQHHYQLNDRKTNAPKSVVFHTKFRMKADRPKEIPDKEVMVGALGGEEVLKSTFTRYAELADEYVKMLEHEERVKLQANNIVKHYTSEACKKAKLVCRYEQRLAALKAEYVKEVEAQVQTNMNAWRAELLKENDVITEAIQMGMEHVPAHAAEAAKKTGIFRSGNTDPVQYDIATIDEWLQEGGHVAEVERGHPSPQG